ncbi:hypothetical protein [Qaidamihabitans albus]|uniref:hypothetical protein n=1 Tax=Qaidamihabitans albus TaxID=2795733 RepID=UPI0018F1E229|nr:hypothetical protein [Qaidamihabitans albus]
MHPPDDEELWVRGAAREIDDQVGREAAIAGARGGAVLAADLALFEFRVTEAGWARWSAGRPVRRRWRA